MSNIISINNYNIDVSKFQFENGFYIRKYKGKTTLFNETHRSCNKCGEIKEFDEFNKATNSFLNVRSNCKVCHGIELNQHYHKTKDKTKIKRSEKAKEYNDRISTYNTKRLPLGYETRNKDGFLQVKCYNCKGWMFVTNRQIAHLLQSQNGTMEGANNIYCSKQCKETCSDFYYRQINKELKAFDLNISIYEYDTLYINNIDLTIVKLTIDKAKQRDNYICQDCGSKTNIEGHHIVPIAHCMGTHDEYLIYDTINIKTVCRDCHRNIEHVGELCISKLNKSKSICE